MMEKTKCLGHVDLVEDDDLLRDSLVRVLTNAGYDVRAWRDGNEFVQHVPDVVPTVVITDMRMPLLSGVEMHKELMRSGRVIPVIYISGESSLTQGIQAMKLGAVDFLIKPFRIDELLQAVARGMARDREHMHHVMDQARLDEALKSLTRREREVHALMLKGHGNVEIMQAMGISIATTKQYKSSVMNKLGVRTLSQLMQLGRVKDVNGQP